MTGRLVWITQEQRDFWVALLDALPAPARAYYLPLMECQDAFDAAPDDPAEAVRDAMRSEPLELDPAYAHSPHIVYTTSIYERADPVTAVLAALGMPAHNQENVVD